MSTKSDMRDRVIQNLHRSQEDSKKRVDDLAARFDNAKRIETADQPATPPTTSPAVTAVPPITGTGESIKPPPTAPNSAAEFPAVSEADTAAGAPQAITTAPPAIEEWPWRAAPVRPEKSEAFPIDMPEEMTAMLRFLSSEDENSIRSMAGFIVGLVAPAVQERLTSHLMETRRLTRAQAEKATAYRRKRIKGRRG